MADKFPVFRASGRGTIADLESIVRQRAIVWANYRSDYIKALEASTTKVSISGQEYYRRFEINANAIKDAENSDHPHVDYLRLLGMSNDDMHNLWKDGFEPSEVDHLQHDWKDPGLQYSLEQAESFYDDVVNALSVADTVRLEGETVAYWETISERPAVPVQAIGEHGNEVSNINDDLDLYTGVKATVWNTTDVMKSKDMDYGLTITLLDSGTDVTPTDEKLLGAIKAMILLEGDDFMLRTEVSKESERLLNGVYYVKTRMEYDVSTVPTSYDMSKYLFDEGEFYQDVGLVPEAFAIVSEILAIWKNYFWKYKELESEAENVELATNGFVTIANGKYYMSVDKVKTMSKDDFEKIVAPSIDIRSVLDNDSFWKVILGGIARILSDLYGGIYNLLKEIPYFALKEQQVIDYLVKYGDPFSSKEFTREEAEVYMEKVGVKSIGLTISIVIAVASWGSLAELGYLSLAGGFTAAVTLVGIEVVMWSIASLLASLMNVGMAAYNAYMDAQTAYDGYTITEKLKELESTKAEPEDEAENAVDLGIITEASEYELQNYIMYEAMYNEVFEPKIEGLSPFDKGGELEIKYK